MGFSSLFSAAGSIASGLIGSSASDKASKEQAAAIQKGLQFGQNVYGQAQSNFQPYITTGQGAETQLAQLTGTGAGGNPLTATLTRQFAPSDLANTPGYQFSLNQGLKAAQNSMTAQGLGNSGQSTAGAANYAEGLAGTTYNQQLQNYLQQNAQTYNMLNTLAQGGQSAAGTLGQIGTNIGQQQLSGETGVGNAQASGTLGSANALESGITGTTNAIGQYNTLQTLASSGSLGALGRGADSSSALSNPNLASTVNNNSLTNILKRYLSAS